MVFDHRLIPSGRQASVLREYVCTRCERLYVGHDDHWAVFPADLDSDAIFERQRR